MERAKIPPMVPLKEVRERYNGMEEAKIDVGKTRAPAAKMNYKIRALDGIYKDSEFPLDGANVIGRDPVKASIVYPENTVGISRVHCRLVVTEVGLQIEDMGSSQGTFLADGTKLEPQKKYLLQNGECFFLASRREIYKVIIF
ncbi:MAG: FHA domain-containing protein [Butyrivibrio sp.]|jgi:hypothetical protein|nr:FHA domain-containing protein [Butyrivibrio sp.]